MINLLGINIVFLVSLRSIKNKAFKMANHKSSKKRIRQDAVKRLRNRYYKKTARTAIAKLRAMTDASEASTFFPKVASMIDKLAKKRTWHKNKAANLKSKLMKHINGLKK
jgi:small subunit ribosomal protein S20